MWLESVESYEEKIAKSIDLILDYGMIDGEHHKQWILDQILRVLLEEFYEEKINQYNLDQNYRSWDIGIAP